jgi:single-stranded DNA-binding protein
VGRDANKVTISGRIVKELDRRTCPNGKTVADFVLISNRKQLPKDDPERPKYATPVKVTLWNDDAEYWYNQDLATGDELLIIGQLFGDDFQPKEGPRTSGRLKIDNVELVKLIKRSSRTRMELDE